MTASTSPAVDAAAFQLAGKLEAYERDVDAMVDTWLDPDLYRRVREDVEELRRLGTAFPAFSVQWVELLIAHAELVHGLWREKFEHDGAFLFEARERHRFCMQALRQRCLSQLLQGD
jgi:hypothetical protein